MLASCVVPPPALAEPTETDPPSYDPAIVQCQVADPRIAESSGLVVDGDRLLTVNDGGEAVTVFVLNPACGVVGEFGAALDPFDVEDLAKGPDGRFWLADTGDNDGQRDTVAIEIVGEDGSAVLYRLSYPDAAPDAEALLVDPSGTPYIVTKSLTGRSSVYATSGPLTEVAEPEVPAPLTKVGEVDLELTGTSGGPVGSIGQLLVTGGAMSPDGRLIALRTYTDAYVWSVPAGATVPEALQAGTPTVVPLPPSPQGEAISFGGNGRDLVVTSEGTPFDLTVVPALAEPEPTTTAPPTEPPTAATEPDSSAASAAAADDQPATLTVVTTAVTVAGLVVVCWSALRPGPRHLRRF